MARTQRPRRTLTAAAAAVHRWHPDDDGTSLFLDDDEATAFLQAAADLHRAMLLFASDGDSLDALVHAQALLDTAMRRLQLELHHLLLLLSAPNPHHHKQLHLEYDDDVDAQQDHDAAMITGHIRAVAEAMLAAGYGNECVSIFKARRRAALAATLHRLLGFSSSSPLNLHKFTWDQVDAKIQSWLAGAAVAFRSVFSDERELCDRVFAGDVAVADAVFAAIAGDQATSLLSVAEAGVARARRAPERLFRVLDVHDALTGTILPAVVSAFGEGSEVAARARAALRAAGEAARGAVAGLEAAIEKAKVKDKGDGVAVHPLTRYVMNYLVFLADYDDALAHIYRDSSPELSPSPNPIGWLLLRLLRKVGDMGRCRREAAARHLFLANNTHYVAKKAAGGIIFLGLGERWAEAQRGKVRGHVDAYVRAAWGSAMAAHDHGVEAAVAMHEQGKWVAADDEMGDALRAAATAAVVPAYRVLYRRQGAAARLTPGDVTAMIAGLFAPPTRRSSVCTYN